MGTVLPHDEDRSPQTPQWGKKRSRGLGLRDGWGQLGVWQRREYWAGMKYTSTGAEEEGSESQFGQSERESWIDLVMESGPKPESTGPGSWLGVPAGQGAMSPIFHLHEWPGTVPARYSESICWMMTLDTVREPDLSKNLEEYQEILKMRFSDGTQGIDHLGGIWSELCHQVFCHSIDF